MAKAIKKQVLGRGLAALLQDSETDQSKKESLIKSPQAGTIVELELELIELNPFQPRTQFKEESIRDLATSIQELGVIQPITVRKTTDTNFQIVSGERRLRATILLGLKTIPAYIRIANDQEALEMALVENIQRQDLDPIEKRSTIANYLRLLNLEPLVQTGMRDGFISMGHGRAIINVNSHSDQIKIYKEILSKKLSVRATENIVKDYNNPKVLKTPTTNDLPEFVKDGVPKIAAYFGHKINVKMDKNGNGKILIPFHSKEDYVRILKLLKSDS
jgi:ParB family chromosome partitioning protein